MTTRRTGLTLILAIGAASAIAAQGWTAAGVTDGVTLSFRDDAQLDAREVRAVAGLPHAADRIVALVCDFTQILDPGVREARLLSGDLAARYEVYLRYSSRYVVVAARDVVIDVRREPHGCSWSEVADRAPARSRTVRMPLLRGSWVVEPLGDSRSRVVYQIAVRPGGRIPAWLVRRGAIDALPDIIARVGRKLAGGDALVSLRPRDGLRARARDDPGSHRRCVEADGCSRGVRSRCPGDNPPGPRSSRGAPDLRLVWAGG